MNKVFSKSLVALAVSSVMSTSAFAGIDGWDHSGFDSRSTSLQANYFAASSSSDVWVNPALAIKSKNKVFLTMGEANKQNLLVADRATTPGLVTNNSGGEGGAFVEILPHVTAGVWVGRQRSAGGANLDTSLRFANYSTLGLAGLTGANANAGTLAANPVVRTGAVGFDVAAVNGYNPKNQGDVFLAADLGLAQVGIRYNLQGINNQVETPAAFPIQTTGAPVAIGTVNASTTTAIAAIHAAQLTAGVANPNVWAGTLTETATSAKKTLNNALENNASFGFALPSVLNIDGAVILGKATGEQSSSTGSTATATTFLADPVTPTTEISRIALSSGTSASDAVRIAGGSTFGVAMRATLAKFDKSALSASFGYGNQEYRGQLSSTSSTNTSTYAYAAAPVTTAAALTPTTTTVVSAQKTSFGTQTNSANQRNLNVTYTVTPAAGSTLLLVTGYQTATTATGSSLRTASDSTTTDTFTAAGVTTATVFNSAVGQFEQRDVTTTTSSVPLVVALEQLVPDSNWTLRGSVAKPLYVSMTQDTTTTAYYTQPGNGTTISNAHVLSSSSTATTLSKWADWQTTVSMGFGYKNGNMTVDTVFSATLNRLFTADHQILQDSKFAKITMGYSF